VKNCVVQNYKNIRFLNSNLLYNKYIVYTHTHARTHARTHTHTHTHIHAHIYVYKYVKLNVIL